jgi:pyruvate/2-oxoglutarate dehydrogenase complex dihydrolipoamide acyltransferase (E2) component
MMTLRYSFDERIEDGLYAGFALEIMKKIIEDPAVALF